MKPDRSRLLAVSALSAATVILADQGTKAIALQDLSQTQRIPLLGDLLGLQLAFNPGAVLSFGAGFTGLLTIIGIGAVALIIAGIARARTPGTSLALGLILGGAVGNLIDRIFSPPGFGVGHVTDFLAYGDLFIGNLADIALGAGVIILAIGLLRRKDQFNARAVKRDLSPADLDRSEMVGES